MIGRGCQCLPMKSEWFPLLLNSIVLSKMFFSVHVAIIFFHVFPLFERYLADFQPCYSIMRLTSVTYSIDYRESSLRLSILISRLAKSKFNVEQLTGDLFGNRRAKVLKRFKNGTVSFVFFFPSFYYRISFYFYFLVF